MDHLIKLSKFQTAVLEHSQNNATEYIQQLAINAAGQEVERISKREINTVLNDPKKKPKMTMDKETIVQEMFDAPGYLNAVDRRAAQAKVREKQRQADEAEDDL